ncbi:MAG: FGGY family carbohydrate kinase [Patescibacteria group bacterium]
MNTGPVLVGVDSGTSGTKAVAYDSNGKLIIESDPIGGYAILGDGIGSSEQLTEQIWQAVKKALRDLTNKLYKMGYTRDNLLAGAMAITVQMHTSVFTDESHQPLRDRVILWNNTAGSDIVSEMIKQFGLARVIEMTNNHPAPGYSLFHSLLVKRSQPDLFQQARHVTLLNSLFGYRLTGRFCLNYNDAAGTSAFDVAKNCWSAEVADWAGIPVEFWPEVISPNELVGEIWGIEEETGIPDGMRLYGGLGDCAAGAAGCGVTKPGQVCAILGTAGIFVVPTSSLVVDTEGGGRVQSYGYINGLSHLLSTNLSAGACIEQFRRMLLRLQPGEEISETELNTRLPLSELDQLAMAVNFEKHNLIIDCRYAGERTGQNGWNPELRGRWLGLTPTTSAGDVFLGLLLGVVFQQMLHYEICLSYQGVTMNDVTLMGGGSKSLFYSRLLTAGLKAINPKVIVRPLVAGQGGGGRGMALVAGLGAGLITDLPAVAGNIERGEPINTSHPLSAQDMIDSMGVKYRRFMRHYQY